MSIAVFTAASQNCRVLLQVLPLAVAFPLPFRVLFLVGLGILGCATNLHGLQLLGIELDFYSTTNHLPLRSQPSNGHVPAQSIHQPMYRIFVGYTVWCFVGWLLFRAATRSDTALVDLFRYIPAVCILGVVTALVCPYDIFHRRERDRFLSTAAKCLFPPSDNSVLFADILFADVLTSFAKVLGDVWLSVCMLLPGGSLLQLPSQDGWYQWILPSLMSLPYLVRLRQCLIEYHFAANSSRHPLFNAIKYASSVLVIFLSAAQRIVISDLVQTHGIAATQRAWHGEHPLFRLWLISVVINSLYSFWWDLTNDWGLDLLVSSSAQSRAASPSRPLSSSTSTRRSHESFSPLASDEEAPGSTRQRHISYPYGLRADLRYPLLVYPMAIFLNFILRMTWSIKLSSHLHSQSDGSALIFWLEMAEILRRWTWVFLRVEWEVVRRGKDHVRATGNGALSDDIELSGRHGKEALD